MPTRGRRRRSGGARTRRKLVWARESIGVTGADPTGSFTRDLLTTFRSQYGADAIGCTVMRIRAQYAVSLGNCVVGIRVFSESTLPVLDASQGPQVSPHLDWMSFVPMLLPGNIVDDTERIDVRAMRKLDEVGQGLLLHVAQVGGGDPFDFSASVSVLLALP